jgi:hypothetical protein
MSRDQGAARGQVPYLPGRCGCGHLETLHAIAVSGSRSGCSASTCSCRRYTSEEEP